MTGTALNIPQYQRVVKLNGNSCSLLDALVKEEISIYSPCGGKGICGKCKVQVHGDVSDISSEEKALLSAEEIEKGVRLACRAHATGPVTLCLPETNPINDSKEKIEAHSDCPANSSITKCCITAETPDLENNFSLTECIREKAGNIDIDLPLIRKLSHSALADREVTLSLYDNQLIDLEVGRTVDQTFGAAIDLGTTTIACYLMDLNSGKQVHVASVQNPQAVYGADVISRIHYCLQNDNGTTRLSEKVKKSISGLLKKACAAVNIRESHLYHCVLVGNTTMNHIFWGLNPASLARVPFTPAAKETIVADAGTAGISGMNPRGKVTFLPCIGGFVGSDTLGAVIASDLAKKDGNSLLIDLGTNGEIVLATPAQMYACSAAAGPAFEGASIEHGMQAFSGAINSVRIDDDLHYTTIDDAPARGLCGSGLIDIVSGFLSTGIINGSGRISDPETVANECLSQRIVKEGRRKKFILARAHETDTGEEIYISQKDIRELQLAKGAIRAGINILLKVAGISFGEIDRILLAGAFGNYINKESARKIGVFPDIPMDRVMSVGNAAGDGAKLVLCDKTLLQRVAVDNGSSIQHVAVSTHQDFEDEFVEGMSFAAL